MLQFLDYFFLIFHALFTVFNLTAWVFKPLRKVHLITVLLTAFSWGVLGIFWGWGYCPLTDWHWQVRQQLGEPIISNSYIHFLIYEITSIDLNPNLVDSFVLVIFILLFCISIFLNLKSFKKLDG